MRTEKRRSAVVIISYSGAALVSMSRRRGQQPRSLGNKISYSRNARASPGQARRFATRAPSMRPNANGRARRIPGWRAERGDCRRNPPTIEQYSSA
jgi:hypothetical protein